MTLIPRVKSVLTGVVLLGGAACGDDATGSGGGVLVIVSGNGQTAHISQPLGSPLIVGVSDAGGGAVPGVAVTWTVTTGTATVTPPSQPRMRPD